MKKLIIRAANKVVTLLSSDKQTEHPQQSQLETPESIQLKRVQKWFADNGDTTHRLNYELDNNSFVIDLGGYEGQWASDIYAMYRSKVWIFEPYLPFAANIERRFKKNPDISLFKFGLGAKDETVGLTVMDNSSSIFQSGDKKESIEIRSAKEFLKTHNITSVQLLKINIEGAEYELLESLLDEGLIKIFDNIQVQFHDFIIPNAYERMKKIQAKLSETHRLTYHYEFVWDNWKRID